MELYFLILIISLFAITITTYLIQKKAKKSKDNMTYHYFYYFNLTLIIHILALLLQIIFFNSGIPPMYFDYITYIGNSYTPIFLLFITLCYTNRKEYIEKIKWIYIIPIIFLVFLFTNDFHHLFYIKYSIMLNETIYGPILIAYAFYSYSLFIVSMMIMIITSIKRSGFFSKQTMLLVIGMSMPVICNVIGVLKILPLTIYIMPIMFIVTSICCSLSIIKYKALNITPVAFRTVMDTMSDAYIVISYDGTIVSTNKTFRNIFDGVLKFDIDENLYKALKASSIIDIEELKKHIQETRKKGNIVTQEYHMKQEKFDRYFEVDFHPISSRANSKDYIGTLLLFKDITQHKEDIKQIQEKQDIIVKQGQLVSIGELAGGVAHDINTPISAIKTGILMLNQMGDKTEEEKEMLQRMDNCATKIINIVNSMRNQIRNLGGDTVVEFKISDVINDIKIITFHEAKKNNSEVIVDIQKDIKIQGDPTKLGQVLTNLVVNAIQAYGTEKGGKVEVIVTNKNAKTAIIKVRDYAGGLDDSIAPFVFKNILTTKGTNGTGLGLYLAYSVIKGNFNGDITFDTKKGEGTTFNITLPIK